MRLQRSALALTALAALAGTAAARAAEPVDAELLEFLGSIDGDGKGWLEFLEKSPVKPPVRAAARAPAKDPAPTTPADAKQVTP